MIAAALVVAMLAEPLAAQFVGPTSRGQEVTVAEVRDMRLGSYVSVTGNILARQRDDY